MSEPPVPDAPQPPASNGGIDLPAGDLNADAVERVSLGARLRQTKTIVSILVPLAIFVVFVGLNREALSKVPGLIAGADPLLILVAFGVFYLGFPLRGKRWAMLLQGTGFRIGLRDSTEILYLSWLINCLIPAKLGDVYRAYLLRIN
ncbi:MAG TPA: lysylphosphatidylglycerol synthase transmembrane domain-containing protein, partial [Candidatus Limnocylindrales bacterium]|nr:lysylphosphatidylglycerol synthase transmembrane domain-containing protein [Candidatus Limnocylindrales bacterium]